MTRLLPTDAWPAWGVDPWSFEPPPQPQYVFLRDRETKENLPFDPALPIPAGVQRKLEIINAVNSEHYITCLVENEWDPSEIALRILRPIHTAIFTDTFALQGRLYTGLFGHQSLSKIERETIRIEGARTCELDYGGLHPRLLYHLEGIDYQDDPYSLWGADTTPPMRLMAKTLINALINAPDRQRAIAACNYKTCLYTKSVDQNGRRVPKTGNKLKKAAALRKALTKTGIKFKDIYPIILQHHQPIAHRFGCDMGVSLMRIDSQIALDTLYHFARRGLPCLGVHDSFIVPASHKAALKRVMHITYKRHTGHVPTIKG